MMPESMRKIAPLPGDAYDIVSSVVDYEVLREREACARMVEDCYTLTTGEANKLAARIRARPAP